MATSPQGSEASAGFRFQTIRSQHESDISQKVVGLSPLCVCVSVCVSRL